VWHTDAPVLMTHSGRQGRTHLRSGRGPRALHAGDVGGEEVDAVAVEVASGAVVVLGGPRVGVPSEDLRVAERDAGIERVGDRGVSQ
jgi:hypothetical protein